MSSALTGCFLAVRPDAPLEAAAEALAAFGVAAEDAAAGADGPGTFHARLYDALFALDPATLDERVRAAVTLALDAALPGMIDQITEKVLIALGR